MEPEFSVIIPSYRRPAELVRCLRALALQNFPRDQFEVIVADDGGGGLESVRDFAVQSFSQCVFVTPLRPGQRPQPWCQPREGSLLGLHR